jgi:hypothetical protein
MFGYARRSVNDQTATAVPEIEIAIGANFVPRVILHDAGCLSDRAVTKSLVELGNPASVCEVFGHVS